MNPPHASKRPCHRRLRKPLNCSFQLFFLLLVLVWVDTRALSSVNRSNESGRLALAARWDETDACLVTVGVRFRTDDSKETMDELSCYVSVGALESIGRTEISSLQLCVDLLFFQSSVTDATQLPGWFVLGVQENRATVSRINLSGEGDTSEGAAFVGPTIVLPDNNFPVAADVDEEGNLFIGLHATNGILPPVLDNANTELDTVLFYLNKLDSVRQSVVQEPLLVKVNVTSGQLLWQQRLETTGGRSTIGGIAHIPTRNTLVVVGSSNGEGWEVGANQASQDWDGYVTLVDARIGEIEQAKEAVSSLGAQHLLRIHSQVLADDFVHGICLQDDKIFVLGSSTGEMEAGNKGGAFVMKIDADTLNILWKRQLSGTGAEALQCCVFQDRLYVAGHVPAGVLLGDSIRTEPSNTQDVFAGIFEVETGMVSWIRQIDSRRDDQLANIMVTSAGDMLLVANAMDLNGGWNDIWTLSLTRSTGSHAWESLSIGADPLQPSVIGNRTDAPADKITIVVAVILPIVLLLLVLVYTMVTRKTTKHDPIPKESTMAPVDDATGISPHLPQ